MKYEVFQVPKTAKQHPMVGFLVEKELIEIFGDEPSASPEGGIQTYVEATRSASTRGLKRS